MDPKPTTAPVGNIWPIPVLLWSPIVKPTNICPDSTYTVDWYADRAVGVLEIAVNRVGGEVDPFGHVGVSEKTIVLLIREAVDDGRLKLSAHFAPLPDAHGVAEYGPRLNQGAVADVTGAFDTGVRGDGDTLADEDGSVLGIEDHPGLEDAVAPDVNGRLVEHVNTLANAGLEAGR